MRAISRAEGRAGPELPAVHDVPLQNQWSCWSALAVRPPNRTTPPQALPNSESAAPLRGAGPVLARCVQLLPFHSQVSPSFWPAAWPPNRTMTPRALS